MLLIYTPRISNRLRFIFNFFFTDILKVPFSITVNKEEFLDYQGPKFSYAPHPVKDELFFLSRNLLFETDIHEQDMNVVQWEGMKIFYSTHRNSALPFDPFAASFFLVTRYEEYLPHKKDQHQRYIPSDSLAYQHDFLHLPVVDQWAMLMKNKLLERFPTMEFGSRKFRFISTIDIDNAYAYRQKGFIRSFFALLGTVGRLDMEELGERVDVLLHRKRDPFDSYEYQLEIQQKYKFPCIYFVLVADYGLNDKNVPYQNSKFQALIKSLADYAEIGVHPGYNSDKSKKKLYDEHARLEEILKRPVNKSRQHFLKLVFPQTYRHLIDIDIREDYTMGYASAFGFRAGTCTPFNYFDLDSDKETGLKVYPFAYMDGTFKDYLKYSPEKALSTVLNLIDEVKKVNGTFISLWHNDSLSDIKAWEGWRKVYERSIAYIYSAHDPFSSSR